MTKNTDEIVVGANGSVYVAPASTAAPDDIATALSASWAELGYCTEDGVTWVDGKTMQQIRGWQSFYDLRRIITEREGSLAFGLMQWNRDTVSLAFGGGTFSSTATGYKYVPPDPSVIDERAMVAEWSDGDKDYRLYFPKGIVSENVETNITRSDAGVLAITFSLLAEAESDAFEFYTNDPAFAASGS